MSAPVCARVSVRLRCVICMVIGTNVGPINMLSCARSQFHIGLMIVQHTPQAFMQSRSSSIVSPCFTPWRHAPVDWLFDWGVTCSVPAGYLSLTT